MQGGSATSFPSYFSLPCKGAYFAVLESAEGLSLPSFFYLITDSASPDAPGDSNGNRKHKHGNAV